MNNKKLGTDFEKEFGEYAQKEGYWVHFIEPDASGAQPFDFVLAKQECVWAVDCKTSARKSFPLSRLEDNQRMAFGMWMRRVRTVPLVVVKHKNIVYAVDYEVLLERRSVLLQAGELGVKVIYAIDESDTAVPLRDIPFYTIE